MYLLIFNGGSSSLSYKVYQAKSHTDLRVVAQGKAHQVGTHSQEAPYLVHKINGQTVQQSAELPDHATAASQILSSLQANNIHFDAIGHRFVHGGTQFTKTTLITSENLPRLEACSPLAPIHNPNSLSVIHLCQKQLGTIPQFAAFDTAFHARMPEAAYRYALPLELADELGLRKYGFHGLSYQYVSGETSRYLGIPFEKLRLVACHLGTGGSSAAAIARGLSLDTSMGYSPLPGLIMSTRSGDLDPVIPLMLIEQQGYTPQQVNRLLNKESGLLGISGFSSDLFEIVDRAEAGDRRARLAFEMYVHRLKLVIGGYLAIMGSCDALVFTDDLGQRCWQLREATCSEMKGMGIELDPSVNREAEGRSVQVISKPESLVKVLVVPTDEEVVIAKEGLGLFEIQEGLGS